MGAFLSGRVFRPDWFESKSESSFVQWTVGCEFRKYEIFDGKYKEFKSQEEGEEKKEAEGEQAPRFRERKEFKPRREGEFKPRRDGESRPRREGEYKPRREGGEFKGGDGRDRKPRGENSSEEEIREA